MKVQKLLKVKFKKELVPNDLYRFLTDANAELFDTPVIGAEVYKSVDSGVTWTKQNDEHLDGVYNSYGYYFGRIHVSPKILIRFIFMVYHYKIK